MGTNEYLRAIRRRWRVIAAATAVALALAGLYVAVRGAVRQQYEATTVLLNSGQISDPTGTTALNIPTLAALVTLGEVPERVAQETGYGIGGGARLDGDGRAGYDHGPAEDHGHLDGPEEGGDAVARLRERALGVGR